MLYIARGVGNHERVTDEVVVEKYRVLPSQYADFATLRGDASDGLPGVAGRRREDRRLAAAEVRRPPRHRRRGRRPATRDMSPGPRRRILDAADYLVVAPKVVAVARDIDLPAYDATLPSEPRDPGRLDELAERYSLDSPVKRLRAVLAG